MLCIFLPLCVLLLHGVSGADTDRESVTVKEGDLVTLNTDVKTNHRDRIKWYFNDTRIAQIIGNISICTDVQCNEGTERFRDRLKLDHQTGSLTITNIRNTDSGEYQLQITSSSIDSLKIFTVTVSGAVVVSMNEGDSVTLNTGVTKNQQDRIMWYFNHTRIAQINGDIGKLCTDVQCKERFRDRLKLDNQTGSLTITNTRNTDSGVYHLQINNRNSEKIFNVTVYGVSAAEQDEVKAVEEGESVTLNPGVMKTPNYVIRLYFNEILITEITGDQSKICTDDQCEKRFRDRLKLDHQTGSLTITNTRNTDSGEYQLEISSRSSSSFSIRRIKSFSVTVTDSGLSLGAVAGICVAVLLVIAAVTAGVIYYHKDPSTRCGGTGNHFQTQYIPTAATINRDPAEISTV
ncbi:uncharacterized protein LOC125263488 isoform X2 [Megalobrama amblycephala]|uniref:uncharacterized protein LOC125263488 isoform X2 n=1 Tax=Megalobrama amblycephala TaxID=75352 RepID=UPI00201433B8|nr:uncharacterized protein LOC125263488 isoform X2 [Megalobrama amblycephala]